MAVIVDKARGDGTALGVDRAGCRSAQLADLDDLAVFDADIAAERGHSRAVDNQSVLDQQIIRHRSSFLRRAGSLLATQRIRRKVYALQPLTQCRRSTYKP